METLLFTFLPKSFPFMDSSFVGTAKRCRSNFIANVTRCQKKTTTSEESVARGRTKTPYSLHEVIFKPLHDFISSFHGGDDNLPRYLDPKHVLYGHFSPVDELPPTACEVSEGSLPPCLDGVYIQNGPNPQFMPVGPYHYVDGDGMLHSIKISGGKATFCSRYVKTFKYRIERDLGYPVLPNAVAYFASNLKASMLLTIARFLTGQFNPFLDGIGTANTSIALVGGRLLALVETDLPYEVKITPDGDITTVGRHDFGGRHRFPTMTAHPKTDPDTGETFAFRHFVVPPYLSFFRVDSDGTKHDDVHIYSMKGAALVHDFVLTKNFAVFPDPQIVIDPLQILRGKAIMRADMKKIPRLGVIPRYAEDEREMYWVDVPGLNVVHTVNAWEEDGGRKIVVVASNVLSVEHSLEDLNQIKIEKITIDAQAKKIVTRYPVSGRNLDFGSINTLYSGKKNRYVYAGVIESMPKMVGLVKIDLSLSAADCTVATRMYGPGCYGSEPVFVAREAAAEEDDGYLVAYVNNENTQESRFLVMDAKSPTLEIVAYAKLPRRVPQGFHSIFVKQTHLHSSQTLNFR
ncbi:nine-cis-epoxycarotenoid dioxygenase 4 [Perilla frutescens var. hirtella]|nr:nine-cis-epoxycarotenoid dioxygenase 4 [Perilla frutescens var. hirtella]